MLTPHILDRLADFVPSAAEHYGGVRVACSPTGRPPPRSQPLIPLRAGINQDPSSSGSLTLARFTLPPSRRRHSVLQPTLDYPI
jgi:hypothetical protein